MDNTSGQGKAAIVPDEVRGWSWGAFLLNRIWGLFNRTWIALAVLIPLIGLVVWVLLGLKGNEWAWRNKRWDDIDHFKRVQRKWAIAGLLLLLLPVVAIAAAVFVLGVSLDSFNDEPKAASTKSAPPAAKAPVPAAVAPAVAPVPAPVPAPVVVPAVMPAPAPPVAVAVVAGKPVAANVAPVAPPPAARAEPAPKAAPAASADAEAKPAAVARKRPAKAAKPTVSAAPVAVAPVPEPPPSPRYNDIMSAVVSGDEAGVRETLAFGKFVDRRDSNGFTPLMVAAIRRELGMARLLLDGGANPQLLAHDGQTAMSIARNNEDAGLTALLRRYGAPDK